MNMFAMQGYDQSAGLQSPVPNTPVPAAQPPRAAAPGSPLTATATAGSGSNQITIWWVGLVGLALLTRIFIEKTGTQVN